MLENIAGAHKPYLPKLKVLRLSSRLFLVRSRAFPSHAVLRGELRARRVQQHQ